MKNEILYRVKWKRSRLEEDFELIKDSGDLWLNEDFESIANELKWNETVTYINLDGKVLFLENDGYEMYGPFDIKSKYYNLAVTVHLKSCGLYFWCLLMLHYNVQNNQLVVLNIRRYKRPLLFAVFLSSVLLICGPKVVFFEEPILQF